MYSSIFCTKLSDLVISVTESVDITISYSIKKGNGVGGGRNFPPPPKI